MAKPEDEALTSRLQAIVAAGAAESAMESRLYRELEQLSAYIQSAKREIAAIRPVELRERDLPMATDQLEAVMGATESATGTILGAAESLEQMAAMLPARHGGRLRSLATSIYEACNFQDVTGQRITKVVRTLKHIETKIDTLLTAFGALKALTPGAARPVAAGEDGLLLHGPQLPGEGNQQAEIDAILANLK